MELNKLWCDPSYLWLISESHPLVIPPVTSHTPTNKPQHTPFITPLIPDALVSDMISIRCDSSVTDSPYLIELHTTLIVVPMHGAI